MANTPSPVRSAPSAGPLTDSAIDRIVEALLGEFPDLRSDDCEDVAHRLSLAPEVIASDARALAADLREGGR